MKHLKHASTAIALVLTLGLVAPSSFGGRASADVSSHNPHWFETTLLCDIGGEVIPYDVVTTGAAASFQDSNSSTVFVVAYANGAGTLTTVDPAESQYNFSDTFAFGPGYPKSKRKGQRLVTCTNRFVYTFTGNGEVVNGVSIEGFGQAGVAYNGIDDITWSLIMSGGGAKVKAEGTHKNGSKHRHHSKRSR